MSFLGLGLSDAAVHGAQCLGYIEPTPIQLKAFPIILSGKDMIGSAQTGTGKTGAFALPLVTLLKAHKGTRCLILEPTRELALQVESAFRDYAKFTDLTVAVIHGGVGFGKQQEAIRSGVDIIVATPGRLLDLHKRGTLSLAGIEYLVLDEVDRMLDMGFLPDVRRIVNLCPKQRQTLLFSATMPDEIERLAAWALKDPEKVAIGVSRTPSEKVRHVFYPVAMDQKYDLLEALLEKLHYESVIIFARTKDGADRVARRITGGRHKVAVIHSDRSQSERTEALDGFRTGRYEVLVATDIVARGIDIAGVSHVVNFDIPQHPEDYVHRIGRTGRADAEGDAITFITSEDLPYVQAIEKFIGRSVPREKMEGFPYKYSTIFNEAAAQSAVQTARKIGSTMSKRLGGRRR